MKKLGVIVLVAVGVLAGLQGVGYLGVILQIAFAGPEMNGSPLATAAAYAAPAAGAFLIATLLITFRASLADRWFEEGDVETSVDAASLVRVMIVAVGVWMVAFGIPAFVGSVLFGLTYAAQGLTEGVRPAIYDILPRAIPDALETAIGMFLIARSARLSHRLWEVRSAQVESATEALPACPSCGARYDPDDYGEADSAQCSHCKEQLPLPRA